MFTDNKLTNDLIFPHKRVIHFFETYTGFWAMSAIDRHFIRQGKKLRMYAVDKRIIITARQIASAYTLLKKHIATDDKLLLLMIKTNTAR